MCSLMYNSHSVCPEQSKPGTKANQQMEIKHNKNSVQFLAYHRKHITHTKQRLPFGLKVSWIQITSATLRIFSTLFSLLLRFFSLLLSFAGELFFCCVCSYWIKDCKTLKLRHIKRQLSHPLLAGCLALNRISFLLSLFCVCSAFFCSRSVSFVLLCHYHDFHLTHLALLLFSSSLFTWPRIAQSKRECFP